GRRLRQEHRRQPSGVLAAQMHAQLEFRLDPVGALAVGLVDHEQVGDFIQPGLHHLHTIAALGHRDHHGRIGEVHHGKLGLANTDGLYNDDVETESVEQLHDLARGAAQSAVAAAAREAADVNPGVAVVVGHAHAIAKYRAAGEGA